MSIKMEEVAGVCKDKLELDNAWRKILAEIIELRKEPYIGGWS